MQNNQHDKRGNFMKLTEAQSLKVGDTVRHKYLKTKWTVSEARLYKTNAGRVRHILINSSMKAVLDEKKLYLWETDGK